MLAVVDEEVGLGALRQCILARVRVRRPLRHRPSLSAAAGIERRGFQGQALGGRGGIQAETIERRRHQQRLEVEERDPSRRLRERKKGARVGAAGKRRGKRSGRRRRANRFRRRIADFVLAADRV